MRMRVRVDEVMSRYGGLSRVLRALFLVPTHTLGALARFSLRRIRLLLPLDRRPRPTLRRTPLLLPPSAKRQLRQRTRRTNIPLSRTRGPRRSRHDELLLLLLVLLAVRVGVGMLRRRRGRVGVVRRWRGRVVVRRTVGRVGPVLVRVDGGTSELVEVDLVGGMQVRSAAVRGQVSGEAEGERKEGEKRGQDAGESRKAGEGERESSEGRAERCVIVRIRRGERWKRRGGGRMEETAKTRRNSPSTPSH